MTDRRAFIAGMLAAGLSPKPTWAEAGSPTFLTAGMKPQGTYVLCGLSDRGRITFELPLPSRGHAAAAHPKLAEAVAFARRPGTFAIVIDCVTGRERARLHAPSGRHFYGHGTFSADGDLLFTTENDFEAARGVVGVWDARNAYRRMGEFSSGGVGPHDIKILPNGKTLAVANGGIETHPETGRAKLNLSTMRPALSYLSLEGRLDEKIVLEQSLHKNSIRHLAVADDGAVAFAMQWQGDLVEHPPLLGIHRNGSPAELLETTRREIKEMAGYAGSVAFSHGMDRIAVTSPRGGVAQVFDVRTRSLIDKAEIEDVCGVAASAESFLLTSGLGHIVSDALTPRQIERKFSTFWDNHLVAV